MNRSTLIFCVVLLFEQKVCCNYALLNLWFGSYSWQSPGKLALYFNADLTILLNLSKPVLGTFITLVPDDGKTPWECKESSQTNIARIEIGEPPSTFETCRCSLRSVTGGSNEVLNIEGFRHLFGSGRQMLQ